MWYLICWEEDAGWHLHATDPDINVLRQKASDWLPGSWFVAADVLLDEVKGACDAAIRLWRARLAQRRSDCPPPSSPIV